MERMRYEIRDRVACITLDDGKSALAALSRDAYATTKRRMRAAEAERALELLERELPA
ncbi:MAG TPA: hypothetical protein VIS07_22505 [Candidatus Binatia bacterium]